MKLRVAPWARWRQTFVDLITKPLEPPADTRVNRLGRKALHEVTIYLGDDNTVYAHHLCLERRGGQDNAEVAIRLCWEAMQWFAFRSGLALNVPAQAAVPVQVLREPTPAPELPGDTVTVPATGENGHH